jgi:hypothetical protein
MMSVAQQVVVHLLDLVTQVPDVIFVKCIFSFGEPQGAGILE